MLVNMLPIDEAKIITPDIYKDSRGEFYESWQKLRFDNEDLTIDFVQDNVSLSKKNVIRGFHYQIESPMTQLVFVSQGEILDVLLDLRKNSSTYGKIFKTILSAKNRQQVLIPKGVAHAFCALSDSIVNYKCSDLYKPEVEGRVLYNSVGISWPCKDPIVSEKDMNSIAFKDLADENLPQV